jgi:hypothetical protein
MATNKTAKTVADENVEEAVAAGEPVIASPVINVANGGGKQITEAEVKRELEYAAQQLSGMKKKSISIPKQMAPILGETLPAMINGVQIRVPVDGESYEIPEAYYEIIKESLKTINSGDVRRDLNLGKDLDAEALISPTKR